MSRQLCYLCTNEILWGDHIHRDINDNIFCTECKEVPEKIRHVRDLLPGSALTDLQGYKEIIKQIGPDIIDALSVSDLRSLVLGFQNYAKGKGKKNEKSTCSDNADEGLCSIPDY